MNIYIQIATLLSLFALATPSPDAPPLSLFGKRLGKSLVNQFPFNRGAAHGHHGKHHDHHGDHHGEHHDSHHEFHGDHSHNAQLRDGEENEVPLDIGTIAAAGQRCVEKVMMVEETKYDDTIECHHSYDKRCHKTYTTDYVPQQVENCDENFVKECHIEYKNVAFNETVDICVERPVRDCDQEGEIVCETVYESECETTYHIHEVEEDTPKCETQFMEKCKDVTQGYSTKQECDKWPQQVCTLEKETVKKYSPETQCEKKPREVCGPGPCPIVPGPKECRKEQKTVVQEVPEESCSLRPQPFCEFETKLVPVLKPSENCVDVPKEVCVRMRTNPRKVKRPVIKKWCYTPTEESGLGNEETTTLSPIDNVETETPEPDDDFTTTEIVEDAVTEPPSESGEAFLRRNLSNRRKTNRN